MSLNRLFLAAAATLALAGNAGATVITFDNFDHRGSDAIDYIVEINDDTAGVFEVKVSIDLLNSPNVGDIRGVGFDISYALVASDINGADVTGVCFDATSCGGGNNLNGGGTTSFEVLLDIGNSGSAGEFFTMTAFTVASKGNSLDCNTFTRFGIRAQSVGNGPNGGGGSSKDVSDSCSDLPPPPPAPNVVEPGPLALLAIGLLIPGLVRRARS